MREPAILSRRMLAAAIPFAALAATPAAALPAPSSPDDATLLDLGRQWDATTMEIEIADALFLSVSDAEFERRRRELCADCDRLSRLEKELFRAILETPAITVAGLAVKARIFIREMEIDGTDLGGRDLRAVELAAAGAEDTLGRATWTLLADVLRLGRTAA